MAGNTHRPISYLFRRPTSPSPAPSSSPLLRNLLRLPVRVTIRVPPAGINGDTRGNTILPTGVDLNVDGSSVSYNSASCMNGTVTTPTSFNKLAISVWTLIPLPAAQSAHSLSDHSPWLAKSSRWAVPVKIAASGGKRCLPRRCPLLI